MEVVVSVYTGTQVSHPETVSMDQCKVCRGRRSGG